MSENFFKDPVFMSEFRKESERIDAIAEAEGRSPLDVNGEEMQALQNDIDALISEGIAEIKKRQMGEKYGYLPNFNEIFLNSTNIANERMRLCSDDVDAIAAA